MEGSEHRTAAGACKPDAGTESRLLQWIGFAIGVKAFMINEGLRQHSEGCPFYQVGKVSAALAGPKKHLVLACSTKHCARMRE